MKTYPIMPIPKKKKLVKQTEKCIVDSKEVEVEVEVEIEVEEKLKQLFLFSLAFCSCM